MVQFKSTHSHRSLNALCAGRVLRSRAGRWKAADLGMQWPWQAQISLGSESWSPKNAARLGQGVSAEYLGMSEHVSTWFTKSDCFATNLQHSSDIFGSSRCKMNSVQISAVVCLDLWFVLVPRIVSMPGLVCEGVQSVPFSAGKGIEMVGPTIWTPP